MNRIARLDVSAGRRDQHADRRIRLLRKGDELKDVFSAFMEMMRRIRSRRELDLESVDAAVAEADHNPQEAMRILNELRNRMKDELS
mgnify:CR=1 FL=1